MNNGCTEDNENCFVSVINYSVAKFNDVIKFCREMAERDDRTKKEEAERKKEEEEEQRRRDAKRMRSAEIRRENRPQNLEDLMKLDLDKAPIKEIKAIMIKMGISPHDCFERADLKKKLIENVPELKFEMERKQSSASISSRGSTSSMSSYGYDATDTISKSY
jgi:ATPase subunit of ABC transporter with duplicated ATPase domains